MADAHPSPETVWLWQRIQITKAFPAYTLGQLDSLPGDELADLLRAMDMLGIEQQVRTT